MMMMNSGWPCEMCQLRSGGWEGSNIIDNNNNSNIYNFDHNYPSKTTSTTSNLCFRQSAACECEVNKK